MKSQFDPYKHHRRSIRLRGYDYALPGAYFITLVAYHRACLFGDIIGGVIHLSQIGKLIVDCWLRLPEYFELTYLDEFVVMPNHLHGIIMINEDRGEASAEREPSKSLDSTTDASPQQQRPKGTKHGSVGAIIQNFKSISTRRVNFMFFERGHALWQRDYYERVIRNERELNAIREYIINNPFQWELDKENPVLK